MVACCLRRYNFGVLTAAAQAGIIPTLLVASRLLQDCESRDHEALQIHSGTGGWQEQQTRD